MQLCRAAALVLFIALPAIGQNSPLSVSQHQQQPAQQATTQPSAAHPVAQSQEAQAPRPQAEDQAPPVRRFLLDLGVGVGTGEYQTDQSALDDDNNGTLVRLRFLGIGDNGIGGGIDISRWRADGLFENVGIEPTDLSSLRVFPHLAARVGNDQARLVARLGFIVQEDELEGSQTGDSIEASTVAFAFGIEPEIFLSRGRSTVSLFGSVIAGFGSTDVDVSPNTYSASSTLLEIEAGLRVTIDQVRIGVGYMLQRTETDESDVTNGTVLFAHDYEFSGAMFTFGVLF